MTRGFLLLVGCLLGCDSKAPSAPVKSAKGTSTKTATSRSPTGSQSRKAGSSMPAKASSEPSAKPALQKTAERCSAPSLAMREDRDAVGRKALYRCVDVRLGDKRALRRCGEHTNGPIDWERLEKSIVLGAGVLGHVRKQAARGSKNGLRRRTLGLVGDSMTVSHAFLRPFSALGDRGPVVLAKDVERRLGQGEKSIIEFYRNQRIMKLKGLWRDSFSALRAAKIGMRTPWAMAGGKYSPLNKMLRLKPAIVVVLYGANDAAYRPVPPDVVADDFERDMNKLLDAIEATGAIAVMNTLARHGDAGGIPNCGERWQMTDWRIAVHTNAISQRAAKIACRRQLPLIDLRAALETALGSGLGGDGIHLSSYAKGSGVLDNRGLRCGANLRNYLTLRMLARLRAALGW